MRYSFSILITLFTGLLLLVFATGCSTLSFENPYETEYDSSYGFGKDDIYEHFNLHRGRWWNHYVRGTWLLAGGHYSTARSDFAAAIRERSEDKWDARMYGMHFIDYFPHRESGIAFYLEAEHESDFTAKEKLFKMAIDELEDSIKQAPSSRAKYYLRLATEGYWSATQADIRPPVLGVLNSSIDRWADTPTLYISRYDPDTDKYVATLNIQASDDLSGIATVSIKYTPSLNIRANDDLSGTSTKSVDERELFIESVVKDFNETEIIHIEPGIPTAIVEVNSTDLAGNSSQPVKIRLVVDTTPPTAAIEVMPDNGTLLDGRVLIKISAEDDKGLKSIQVGEDPSGSRDCRGKTTWEGTFYVERDVSKLAIKVSDRAGNVTANDITLDQGLLAGRWRAYASHERPSFGYDFSRLDNFLAVRSLSDNRRLQLPRVIPVKAYYPQTLLGPVRVQRLVVSQTRSLAPELVLRDLLYSRSIQTPHHSYRLQGEIRNAHGPVTVKVKINSKLSKSISVANKGDYSIFSYNISLPEFNKELQVSVEASTQDGKVIDRIDFTVKRVNDYISEPNDVYYIMMLPLEEQQTATDPNSQFRDLDRANKVVLDALCGVRLHNPDDSGQSYQRFNCNALDSWTLTQISADLTDLKVADSSPEEKFAALADDAKYKNDQGRPIELGFFGDVKEDADSIEIILKVIIIENKEIIYRRIDIFGSKPDYERCTNGLISKLHRMIPRIHTGITCGDTKSKKVTVGLGRDAGVFQNMDVGLYLETADGRLEPLNIRTAIIDVRRDISAIQIGDRRVWNNACNIIGGKTIAISR